MSEKMDEWLRKLSQRHKKIVEELEGESQDQERFLRDLIGLLEEINDFYKRVFSFSYIDPKSKIKYDNTRRIDITYKAQGEKRCIIAI